MYNRSMSSPIVKDVSIDSYVYVDVVCRFPMSLPYQPYYGLS